MRKRGKKYQLQVRYVDPASGRARRKSFTGKTKGTVEQAAREFRQEVDRGLAASGNETLGTFFQRWLDGQARPRVRPSTYREYAITGRVFVAPLGGVQLKDVRPAHIEQRIADLASLGRSNRTIAKHLTVLRGALKHAVQIGALLVNPANLVSMPRVEPREPTQPSLEQAQRLLDSISDLQDRRHAYVAIQTGLRAGELLALRWSDIDLDAERLSVTRARNNHEPSGFAPQRPRQEYGVFDSARACSVSSVSRRCWSRRAASVSALFGKTTISCSRAQMGRPRISKQFPGVGGQQPIAPA